MDEEIYIDVLGDDKEEWSQGKARTRLCQCLKSSRSRPLPFQKPKVKDRANRE